MLYPIVPLYLTSVFGATPEIVGTIEGFAQLVSSLLSNLSGVIADRYARRPLVGAGYAISSFAKLLMAAAWSWIAVAAFRAIDRVGKGMRDAPRDALIAADTAEEMRGTAFGFHRALDSAGAVAGPLLGIVIVAFLTQQLRWVFVIAAVPAFASLSLVWLVRERRPAGLVSHGSTNNALPPLYYHVLAVTATFALVNFPNTLIVLKLSAAGMQAGGVLASYALYNATYALASYPAGRLSDRVPRPAVYGFGMLLFAAAYYGLGLAQNVLLIVFCLAVYGVYSGLTDGVGRAWISDLVDTPSLGRALGIFQAVQGLGSLAAGVWAGALWRHGSLPFFIAASAAFAVGGYVLVVFARSSRP